MDAHDIIAHDGFQPALGLLATEGMSRIASERVAVNLKVVEQLLERGSEADVNFCRASTPPKNILPSRQRANAMTRKRSHTSLDCTEG